MSHFSNFHTTTCHIIPIITRPHITLFQLTHDHISHYSKCRSTICHIIPNITRPHVTLFQFLHDHMSHYSKNNLYPNQYDFSKEKPMFVASYGQFSSQVASTYLKPSRISDLISLTILLTNLLLSDGTLTWFCI